MLLWVDDCFHFYLLIDCRQSSFWNSSIKSNQRSDINFDSSMILDAFFLIGWMQKPSYQRIDFDVRRDFKNVRKRAHTKSKGSKKQQPFPTDFIEASREHIWCHRRDSVSTFKLFISNDLKLYNFHFIFVLLSFMKKKR